MVTAVWIVARDKRTLSMLSAGLADVGDVTALNLSSFPGYRFPYGAAILFDIDLDDAGSVGVVRDGLRRANGPRPIFAVDFKIRRHKVQADALGGVAVVGRPFDIKQIKSILNKLGEPPPDPNAVVPDRSLKSARTIERKLDPRDANQSVGLGGAVLGRLFDGVLSGGAFDPSTITAASAAIGESIEAVGIDDWLRTMREHHTGTFLHCLLVTGVATRFAQKLGLPAEEQRLFTAAALLHDIGKARIPLQILDKPGPLTEAEFHIMKKHPSIGAAYLVKQGSIDPRILDMVLHHHEYLNGSGYPDGLPAEKIPVLTRALTISDVFGALIEERRYKLPMPADKAYGIREAMVGEGRLDRDLVRVFAAVASEIGTEATTLAAQAR